MASVSAIMPKLAVTNEDVHCSYLPLAHMFERIVMTINIHAGGATGFYTVILLFILYYSRCNNNFL